METTKDPRNLKCKNCGEPLDKWTPTAEWGVYTGFQSFCKCNHVTTLQAIEYNITMDEVSKDDPNYQKEVK